MKTPYDVLGVSRNAAAETIRLAFRKAAKVHHPDLNAGDPTAGQQMRLIIAAYDMLKNPEERAVWDQYLRSRRRAGLRNFAAGVAGLVGGSIVALMIWPPGWLSKVQEASGPSYATLIAAASIRKGASLHVAPNDDGGGRQEEDVGHVRRVPYPNRSGPLDDGQSAGSPHSTADHPEAQALLATEWEQVQASGDAMAVWAFTVRNPDAPESEAARSMLVRLIDASEDVSSLQVLRLVATGAIAERAQQRLVRLGALPVAKKAEETKKAKEEIKEAKEDRVVVSDNNDDAAGASTSKDPAFYLARGELRSRRGDFDRAIADFDEAIRLGPGKALAYSHRGNAWRSKGDQDRALADYEAAIRIDPNNPGVLRDRSILWRGRGDLDRALVDLDRAIRLGFSDANAYNERGLVWYEKKRYDRAIADFNQALKVDPNLVSALVNRGIAWRSKGDLDRAVTDFDLAIRLDPALAAAHYNRERAWTEKRATSAQGF